MTRLSLTLLVAAFLVPVATGQGLPPHTIPADPIPAPRPEPTGPVAQPTPAAPNPAPAVGQAIDRVRGPRRLGGPRTGVTVLSARTIDRINEAFDSCYEWTRDDCVGEDRLGSIPVVTQFGWQFETRLFQAQSGLTGVSEWVVLVGGAERGLFLPSLTFLAGLRGPGGFEVGVGPNLSLGGAAYAVAVGFNNESGEINIPLNLAVVLGQDGPRASVLVGFNVSERRW
ncbi:MAG: hypothetical protein AAGK21_17250 [Bacteroidota bacterium]